MISSLAIQRTEIQPIVYKNDIYVFGGFVLKTAPRLNTLTKLNIHSGICELVETEGEIPTVRSGHSVVQWKNFMFVYGGWDAVISKNVPNLIILLISIFQDMYRLDLETLIWEREIPLNDSIMPLGLRSHAAVVYKNEMFMFGGTSSENPDSNLFLNGTLYAYNMGKYLKF